LNIPIVCARYVLILAPAIATLYLEPIDSYGWYVFTILALLSVVETRRMIGDKPAAFALLIAELLACGWIGSAYHGILYLLVFSALLTAKTTLERTVGWLVGAVAMNAALVHESPANVIAMNVLFATVCIVVYRMYALRNAQLALGSLNDELRGKHYQLDEAQRQLLDYAKKVENAAQLEERNRISRDIHDELGHKLIRLKLMMDAVVHILPVQPEKGQEMAESVRAQLAESMEMLRATVRRLKPKDAGLRAYSIETLVGELRRDGRLSVLYETAGMPYPLYPSLEVGLYRNAQEAITNAIRHGGASEVAILVTYEPHQVTMEVSNNGEVPSNVERRGLGLSGMEERTALLGGSLRIDSRFPFTVRTCLPTGQLEERSMPQ